MERTHNQIIFYLEQFTDGHPQLNSFGEGFQADISEYIKNNVDGNYLYVVPVNINLNKNTQDYRYRIYGLEIKQKNNYNSRDALSDTAQILNDLRKFLIYNFEGTNIWSVTTNSTTLQPVNNYTQDYTIGWYMDITISGGNVECDSGITLPITIPINPVPDGFTCDDLPTCPTIISLTDAINNVDQEVTIIENNITNINNTVNQITQDITQVTQEVTIIQQEVTVIENNITNINNNIFNIEGDLTDLEETLLDIEEDMLTCENLAECRVIKSKIWTVDFTDDIFSTLLYAPYNLTITSITNVLNTPTVSIFVNDVAYTLGNTINIGDEIKVVVDGISVINLNIIKI